MDFDLIPASSSILRQLLAPVAPLDSFWVTYRLPFQPRVTITYPTGVEKPEARPELSHELHHVEQLQSWWAPWIFPLAACVFPLPVLFSGRWFIERYAYLSDIKSGRRNLAESIDTLWYDYGYAWPRPLMRRWFYSKLSK